MENVVVNTDIEHKSEKPMSVYKENGFIDQQDYHEHLADKLSVNMSAVTAISKFLGEEKDFTQLPKVLKRIINPSKVFAAPKPRKDKLRTRVSYSEID